MVVDAGWPGGLCMGPCFTALKWISRYFICICHSEMLFGVVLVTLCVWIELHMAPPSSLQAPTPCSSFGDEFKQK